MEGGVKILWKMEIIKKIRMKRKKYKNKKKGRDQEVRNGVETVRDGRESGIGVMADSLIDLIGSHQRTTVGMNQTHPQAG